MESRTPVDDLQIINTSVLKEKGFFLNRFWYGEQSTVFHLDRTVFLNIPNRFVLLVRFFELAF